MNRDSPKAGALAERLAGLSPAKRKAFELLARTARMAPESAGQQTLIAEAAAAAAGSPPETTLSRELLTGTPGGAAADPKLGIQRFYDRVSAQLNVSGHGLYSMFLNFGYAGGRQPDCSRVVLPRRCLNRNCVRLVCELVGDCPIAGRRVLDVGCGRGGTVYVLNKFFAPQHAIGLDLSAEAIAFCRRSQGGAAVEFLQGDAENLPFGAAEFDVVTNVESSHSYPRVERFYDEVSRVLRPGGCFLYTDLLPNRQWDDALARLGGHGFAVEIAREITDNVRMSCDETGPTHLRSFQQQNDRELMGNFLGLSGSAVYESMTTGASTYRIYRLRQLA